MYKYIILLDNGKQWIYNSENDIENVLYNFFQLYGDDILKGIGIQDIIITNKNIENGRFVNVDKKLLNELVNIFRQQNTITDIEAEKPNIDEDDDFPYKRLNYTDQQIFEMFDKLQKYNVTDRLKTLPYKLKNVDMNPNELLFMGNPTILLNYPTDYKDWNLLSDMFQEKCRIQCKLFNQLESMYDYYKNNKERIIKETNKKYGKSTPFLIREYLYETYKECTSHRPSNMVALIQMFNAKSVFDFSSGWGDRLLGAMAMDVDYCGVDPNKCLHPNYQQMIRFFNKNPDKYLMLVGKIEDVDIPRRNYDLIYTSPPYFDLEIYNNHDKELYSNEDIWFDKFLAVALIKSWNVLIPNGVMAININQKNRKEKYIRKMLNYVGRLENSLYLGVISYSEENLRNPQPIWIWRKLTSTQQEI
jgi:hypothetical protein